MLQATFSAGSLCFPFSLHQMDENTSTVMLMQSLWLTDAVNNTLTLISYVWTDWAVLKAEENFIIKVLM